MWGALVDEQGAVWSARCDWGGIQDGGWCSEWVYARVSTTPIAIAHKEPKHAPSRPMPRVAAPSDMSVAIVKIPREPNDDGSQREPLDVLRCTEHGKTIEYPAEADRAEFFGVSELTWISTSPPVFHFIKTVQGYTSIDSPMTFEGCAESMTYANAQVEGGPSGIVAVFNGTTLVVTRNGRAVGTLPGVSLVAFPPR